MAEPKTIEWSIGKDIHDRPVTLRQERHYGGRITFSIISAPINQRDEGEKIHSLSRENLNHIAQIEASLK
jgi:hypothetical protein